MRRLLIASVAAALTASLAAAPALAVPAGSYKGKIAYQGYDITFKVKGSKITKIVARMLQDCDRDGSSEVFLIAPDASWKIGKDGRFKGKKVQRYGQSAAHVTFEGRFKGSQVTGSIREWDTVEGSGIVCDTLVRKFTARRR
jgi:hypothetical protein